MKMNDRWKDYKANLKKAYYTPCLHSPSTERFHCQDGRVNQGQWKLLVQLWDTGDAQKRATASRKNRKALQIYHTTGTKSFAQIRHEHDEFNTKLKLYADRNEIITEQVCHNVYADVLGPERYNRVRGFGTGVV
ncbi:hypothetical protein C1H46_008868 [Malus baccata]|uniref:Uncharacterized protein n=1 Tax=Malus baccata TaxID=106549 RepID=A0A540N4S2_MALBA|nr:hypothetical protein C1H46_008868 [Malus baccata]